MNHNKNLASYYASEKAAYASTFCSLWVFPQFYGYTHKDVIIDSIQLLANLGDGLFVSCVFVS